MPLPPTQVATPRMPPFANTDHTHVFRFTFQQAAQPLYPYLVARYRYGRSEAWRQSFYPHRIRLNDEPVTADTVVRPGDEVAYLHYRCEEPAVGPLPVLHEDAWLLALHKPDTIPVNPAGVYYFTSLAILARERLGLPELTPLHRLDLETDGVLLCARHRKDVGRFHKLFIGKAMTKRYRALVHGHYPTGHTEIAGRIEPAEGSAIETKLRLAPTPPGPDAPTLTRVLNVRHLDTPQGAFSELVLEPVTGKTNQLRVHLAHVGHPIVGDKKYHPDEGVFLDWVEHRDFARLAELLLLPRQALQCERMALTHPFTGEAVSIEVPPEAWRAKVAGV